MASSSLVLLAQEPTLRLSVKPHDEGLRQSPNTSLRKTPRRSQDAAAKQIGLDDALAFTVQRLVSINSCSSINRLPPEILSLVFTLSTTLCILDQQFNFFYLTRVCRLWRQIALDTPSLWSHIDIGPDIPQGLTRLLLDRTKNWPIRIHLYEPPSDSFGLVSTPDRDVQKVIQTLEPHIHRVRTLSIESECNSGNLATSVVNLWLDRGNADITRSLTITCPTSQGVAFPTIPLSNNASQVLSSLQSLHLEGVQFDWDSVCYRNLADLNLAFADPVRVNASRLANVLSSNPALVTLALANLAITDLSDRELGLSVSLAHLNTLRVSSMEDESIDKLFSVLNIPPDFCIEEVRDGA